MPVHVILGEERYLQETTTLMLCQQFGVEDELSTVHYSLLEHPIQTLIADANTTSLFSSHKIIIGTHAYFLTGKKMKQTFDGDHQVQVLEQYVEYPNSQTLLILIVPTDKFDERKKVVKLLKQKATIHYAQPLQEKQLVQWVDQQCQVRAIQFEASAKQALIQRCDAQLEMLANELDKYATYGKQGRYDYDDVMLLTPDNLKSDVFLFIDALLMKRFFVAEQQYKKYLAEGEDVFGMIALISGQLKLILQAQLLLDSGLSQQAIATRLSIHPYRVKIALQKSRQYHSSLVQQTLLSLLALDVDIKQGKMDKNYGFELFMIRFCQV